MLVVVVMMVMRTERVRETHQPAQGASELGVRMLEYPTVHARLFGCVGAEVKLQREAVWLNMQSETPTKAGRGERSSEAEGECREPGWPRCWSLRRWRRGPVEMSNPAPSLREPAH